MGVWHKQGKNGGFTIIEVILFLGITGLLALTLLGGWTTMINTQRYKDSVKTVQSFLQTQYNLVYNVENAEQPDGGPYCDVNASDEPQFVTTESPRGQSDCIQMGRLIHISGGVDIRAYAIVGADMPNSASTDAAEIIRRNPIIVENELQISENELTVPWQAEVVNRRDIGGIQNVALAIVRSPLSGSVHTYRVTTDGVSLPDVEDMIAVGNEQEVNLCLDPGTAFAGNRIGVVIRERASAQSFVQIIQDEALC
jgi:type II secretory pathway pseudopilin PulG